MTATGEIVVITGEGWAVALGLAITRWGRRRAARARLRSQRDAAAARERRADLDDHIAIERELQGFRREHERTIALQRLHSGL